ncbi:MAG: hypothetical protein ACTSQG_03855 [Promethearchaeota archaeon]
MIFSKTPVRIEIGGGATDVEPYSTEYGGFVVNVTINKYMTCKLTKRPDNIVNIYANKKNLFIDLKKIDDLINNRQKFGLFEAIFFFFKAFTWNEYRNSWRPSKKSGFRSIRQFIYCFNSRYSPNGK